MRLTRSLKWSPILTFVIIPIGIFALVSALMLSEAYFVDTDQLQGIRFSSCVFKLKCSWAEWGPYSISTSLIFALSWIVAYNIHYSFPEKLWLLCLGVFIAAPFYALGFYGTEILLDGSDYGEQKSTIKTYAFVGFFGAFFHIFGLAIALRIAKKFFADRNQTDETKA